MSSCKVITPDKLYPGKQWLHAYRTGICQENSGSRNICMMLLEISPGEMARAHKHVNHETTIYVLEGKTGVWWGDRLENHSTVDEGQFFYIPANVPHKPYNLSQITVRAVIARTDPNEQESVVLLPELDS